MTTKALHYALWVAQILVCLTLLWAGSKKIFYPGEVLSAEWPWTGEVSSLFVKLTGVLDWTGAIGIIVPTLIPSFRKLTVVAAIGIIALMVSAIVFHILRGEVSVIGVNIFFSVIVSFIAWGRGK
ncbi:MAG TPA: DoxX family protein [Cytophagales bacterium]|nr:DoxX family protein [Cytophagales bacterium]